MGQMVLDQLHHGGIVVKANESCHGALLSRFFSDVENTVRITLGVHWTKDEIKNFLEQCHVKMPFEGLGFDDRSH